MKLLNILIVCFIAFLCSCSDSGGKTTYTLTGVVTGEGELSGIEVKLYSLQFEKQGVLLALDTTDESGVYTISAETDDEPLFMLVCNDPSKVYQEYEEKILSFTGAVKTGSSEVLERDIRLQKR